MWGFTTWSRAKLNYTWMHVARLCKAERERLLQRWKWNRNSRSPIPVGYVRIPAKVKRPLWVPRAFIWPERSHLRTKEHSLELLFSQCSWNIMDHRTQGVHKVKIIFTILRCYCLFLYIDICTDGGELNLGKTSHNLTSSTAAKSLNIIYCILHCHILSV